MNCRLSVTGDSSALSVCERFQLRPRRSVSEHRSRSAKLSHCANLSRCRLLQHSTTVTIRTNSTICTISARFETRKRCRLPRRFQIRPPFEPFGLLRKFALSSLSPLRSKFTLSSQSALSPRFTPSSQSARCRLCELRSDRRAIRTEPKKATFSVSRPQILRTQWCCPPSRFSWRVCRRTSRGPSRFSGSRGTGSTRRWGSFRSSPGGTPRPRRTSLTGPTP